MSLLTLISSARALEIKSALGEVRSVKFHKIEIVLKKNKNLKTLGSWRLVNIDWEIKKEEVDSDD